MIIANNHHCYIISINILADVKKEFKREKNHKRQSVEAKEKSKEWRNNKVIKES